MRQSENDADRDEKEGEQCDDTRWCVWLRANIISASQDMLVGLARVLRLLVRVHWYCLGTPGKLFDSVPSSDDSGLGKGITGADGTRPTASIPML